MKKRKVVPSFLTSMNLLCGFWAILINDPILSFYLVLIGIAFDFVDGFSARALKVPSQFGKELDSLADMVTFGVVPGFLFYHHVLKSDTDEGLFMLLNLLIATLVPVFAGLRLAKFNVKDSGKIGFAGFAGLPSSAAALAIIAVPFVMSLETPLGSYFNQNQQWLFFVPLFFSILMVTDVPMFNFKSFKAGIKGNLIQLIYVATLIPIALVLRWDGLIISILWYIVLSVLSIKIWRK